MTQTEQGDLTQSVSLSYRDYIPENGKVDTVRLTFDYDKRENEYFLTDKSDEQDYFVSHSSSGLPGLFSINKRG